MTRCATVLTKARAQVYDRKPIPQDLLASIACPVLILRGADDNIVCPLKACETWQRYAASNSRRRPGSGNVFRAAPSELSPPFPLTGPSPLPQVLRQRQRPRPDPCHIFCPRAHQSLGREHRQPCDPPVCAAIACGARVRQDVRGGSGLYCGVIHAFSFCTSSALSPRGAARRHLAFPSLARTTCTPRTELPDLTLICRNLHLRLARPQTGTPARGKVGARSERAGERLERTLSSAASPTVSVD